MAEGGHVDFIPWVVFDASDQHKTLRLVAWAVFYTCFLGAIWIQGRYAFERLGAPTKWYVPWKSVRFSVSQNARIRVRDINFVAQWYTDKLGMRKAMDTSAWESDCAVYKFKEDGKSITLTSSVRDSTARTLILLTKRIGKMKEVLSARGIAVGNIEQDRQGTRYFEIHDPEENTIEVVEEH